MKQIKKFFFGAAMLFLTLMVLIPEVTKAQPQPPVDTALERVADGGKVEVYHNVFPSAKGKNSIRFRSTDGAVLPNDCGVISITNLSPQTGVIVQGSDGVETSSWGFKNNSDRDYSLDNIIVGATENSNAGYFGYFGTTALFIDDV